MATVLEKISWNLYNKKSKIIIKYGLSTGLIHPYEEEFIENLRQVYLGGVPASIVLLCNELCVKRCYDRGLLLTLGFGDDDFKLVNADIDWISKDPITIDKYNEYLKMGIKEKHPGQHCFAERTKKDGSIWVYDPTMGLVFEKSLYYRMEKPKITKINDRKATEAFCEYQDIKSCNIEHDKYSLPFIMPTLEKIANTTNHFYKDWLKEEIKLFKETIGYEEICDEIHQDMISKGFKYGLRHR